MFKFIFAFVALLIALFVVSCGSERVEKCFPPSVHTEYGCEVLQDPVSCGPGTVQKYNICVLENAQPLYCGEGTRLLDHTCVPSLIQLSEVACGPGTQQVGRFCLVDPTQQPAPITCGEGTHLEGGVCKGDIQCSPGTHANTNGVCVPDANPCQGATLHVPEDCRTIQEAVDAAVPATHRVAAPLTTVLLAPGIYHENVQVPDAVSVLITKNGDGEVIVDGGASSAFATGSEVNLSLQDVTIRSQQTPHWYSDATVFMEFGGTLNLQTVIIHTTWIAVSVNYTSGLVISGSSIFGDGSVTSLGLGLYHEGSDYVRNNRFQNLGTAIRRCSGGGVVDLGISGSDSNSYSEILARVQIIPGECSY